NQSDSHVLPRRSEHSSRLGLWMWRLPSLPVATKRLRELFWLQEQLVGMAVGPATELTAIVGQDGVNGGVGCLEGRDYVVVHEVGPERAAAATACSVLSSRSR